MPITSNTNVNNIIAGLPGINYTPRLSTAAPVTEPRWPGLNTGYDFQSMSDLLAAQNDLSYLNSVQGLPKPSPPVPKEGGAGLTLALPSAKAQSEAFVDYAVDKRAASEFNAMLAKKKGEASAALKSAQGRATSGYDYTISGAAGNGSILDTAKQYLGIPYLWGGTGKGGYDCSGFTGAVARNLGYSIPRTAKAQLNYFASNGLLVKDLQPGDFMYFKSSGPSGYHTGIYVGNGMIIDAPGTGQKIHYNVLGNRTVLGIGRLPAQTGDARAYKDAGVQKGSAKFGLDPTLYERIGFLNAAMRGKGLGTIAVSSGFRSRSQQEDLHADNPSRYAPAGQSLHGRGVAADLKMTTAQAKFAHTFAPQIGLEFPAPSEEPWHVEMMPK